MIESSWEVTLNGAGRENFSVETTFKFNKYKLYIHGKIRKDYKTISSLLGASYKIKFMRRWEGSKLEEATAQTTRRKRHL